MSVVRDWIQLFADDNKCVTLQQKMKTSSSGERNFLK